MRRGERVRRFSSWDGVDLPRLRALIESSFGRELVSDYYERTQPCCVLVSENYRAAMVLVSEAGMTYLDKFAVLDDAQGEGLGRAVWRVMRAEYSQMFWRSRHGNSVNHFYYAESDGCIKQEHWKVFWYGLEHFDDIARCVAFCAARPPSLQERTT